MTGHVDVVNQLRRLIIKIKTLNIYFNRHKSSAATLRVELLSTRMYLLLWSLTFTLLILSNALSSETTTKIIKQPSEATYKQLEMSFETSLQCPCSQSAFSYHSFVQIKPQLHQICYSEFIKTAWIKSIFEEGNWSNIPENQFLGRGVAYFLVQKYLCNEAQLTIDSIINAVLSYHIVEGKIVPNQHLVSRIQTELGSWVEQTKINFNLGILAVRAAIQVNQLINIFSTSWTYAFDNYTQVPYYRIPTRPATHGSDCSCAISSTCTEPIFVGSEIALGFALGCSPIESLMRSTFVCLYNQTCLDLINVGNLSVVNTLNASLLNTFRLNTTVEEMAKNVFLEQILVNVNYTEYFSLCQPLACTYLTSNTQNIIQAISFVLGLYGGLTLILYSITNWLVAAVYNLIRKIRQNNSTIHPFS